MEFIEITNNWKPFHAVPQRIYKNDPNWISPIESDIEAVFSPEANKTYANGESKCWVLLDDQQKPAGRIAAFIDHERNKTQPYPIGGIGFFDCIERADYAKVLLQKAEDYLRERGVKVIEGLVNFGEREKFWGLLVKGFFTPVYQENYNPPYYQDFLEDFGYQPYEQILTLECNIAEIPIRRFNVIAKRAKSKHSFMVKNPEMNRLDDYARDFNIIYEGAFSHFPHFKPLTQEQTLKLFKATKPIVDAKAVGFAYVDEKPVGFIVLLPEINPFLKHANGKMNPWNILRFLFKFRTAKKKGLKGIAFGVVRDYQKKGVESVMIDAIWHNYTPNISAKYDRLYLTTIRAHNEIMVNSVGNLGVKPNRIHVTYRKLLEAGLALEPFKMPHEV